MRILTCIAPKAKPDFNIRDACPNISATEKPCDADNACQWVLDNPLSFEDMQDLRAKYPYDFFQTTDTPIKLFLADMDSTIVVGETLDDMAAHIGIGDQVADITRRAMRGELNFEQALRERVAMLKGQPDTIIRDILGTLEYNKGARELVQTLKSRGVYCVLISGGFTQFTSHVAQDLGFDAHFGNQLDIKDGHLTGDVIPPILDKDFKLQTLKRLQHEMNLDTDAIMAIGDGANDLPMLQSAGVGVAFYGKPLLQSTLMNQINHGDLTCLLKACQS